MTERKAMSAPGDNSHPGVPVTAHKPGTTSACDSVLAVRFGFRASSAYSASADLYSIGSKWFRPSDKDKHEWDGREPMVGWFLMRTSQREMNECKLTVGPLDQVSPSASERLLTATRSFDARGRAILSAKAPEPAQDAILRVLIGYEYRADDILSADVLERAAYVDCARTIHLGAKGVLEEPRGSMAFGNFCTQIHARWSAVAKTTNTHRVLDVLCSGEPG